MFLKMWSAVKILTAQGSLNASPCLVNYYPVCQTGTAMVPLIDGREDVPQYLYMRWFGFSITYPKCSIYQQAG